LLQYHVHVPEPNPLTNADSEARFNFYEDADRYPDYFFNGGVKAATGRWQHRRRDGKI
jgi:hypothetical protein